MIIYAVIVVVVIVQEHTRFDTAFQRIQVIVTQHTYDATFSIRHLTA